MIERHPADGAAMLAPYPHLAEVAHVVRSHHERPDGRGYPDRLAGPDVPLTASIVSVVDAWDAMVSDRPYRSGMPPQRAEAILRDGAGTQWLPAAVDAVLAEIHTGGPVTVPHFATVGRAAGPRAPRHEHELVDACLPEHATLTGAH